MTVIRADRSWRAALRCRREPGESPGALVPETWLREHLDAAALGFTLVRLEGGGSEPGVIRFGLAREDRSARGRGAPRSNEV